MSADQIMHLLRHGAQQSTVDVRPHMYGHIASYDPALHRARCIIPSLTDENGVPQLSPWMPVGSPWQGAQYIYKGGASTQNPTAGEQVIIGVFDRFRGVSAVPCTFYNTAAQPPAARMPSTDNGYQSSAAPLSGGDVLISNPPASSTPTLIRIRGDTGDIEMWGAAKLNAQTIGDVSVTSTGGKIDITSTAGNVTVTANGIVTLVASAVKLCKSLGDVLQTLCTKALRDWAATHVHGANLSPPTTQPPVNALTTITTAE